jgi:hypothetical protein
MTKLLRKNPVSGIAEEVEVPFDFNNKKLNYYLAALSAYDRIANVTYLDAGFKNQRIDTIVLTSALYPDSDIIKAVYYLDVGTMNQRIDKIEISGDIFSPQILVKSFQYSLQGIRFVPNGWSYNLV